MPWEQTKSCGKNIFIHLTKAFVNSSLWSFVFFIILSYYSFKIQICIGLVFIHSSCSQPVSFSPSTHPRPWIGQVCPDQYSSGGTIHVIISNNTIKIQQHHIDNIHTYNVYNSLLFIPKDYILYESAN